MCSKLLIEFPKFLFCYFCSIPFLYVLVNAINHNFNTSLFKNKKKNTTTNTFLPNYKSECPHRYKIVVIVVMNYQSKVICSLDILFYKEFSNTKQTLINNNFHEHVVDEEIKLALTRFRKNNARPPQIKINTPLTDSIVTLIVNRMKN